MVQRPPTYRISPTVFMNTKRPSRASNQKRRRNASITSPVDDDENAVQDDSGTADIQDDLLTDSEKKGLESWSPDAEDDEDVPLEQLLLDDEEEDEETLVDEELLLNEGFQEDSEDIETSGVFDEEGDDNDDVEDEDEDREQDEVLDEDEELAAQATGDDFDDGIPIPATGKRQQRVVQKKRNSTLKDLNDEENVDTSEDVLNSIPDGFEPVFEAGDSESDDSNPDLTALNDENSTDDLDEQSAEDIRNAANILSKSGILGLGLGEERSGTTSAVESLTSADDGKLEDEEEYDLEGLFDFEDEQETDEKGNDDESEAIDFKDRKQRQADAEFALTSESNFGKVWELNEDTYVTITEPGQAYAYELDEDDEEDQEMSTVRRGKQGGWSGGLASYPTSADLPVGSKEYIARRSYELLSQFSPAEMFQWTRRHSSPPRAIEDLYPKKKPKPTFLGKQILHLSTPDSSFANDAHNNQENADFIKERRTAKIETTDGKERSAYTAQVSGDNEFPRVASRSKECGEHDRTALDRSVEFPCSFKFKIESIGEGFRDYIQQIVEDALCREVEQLTFSVEKEGKLERIEFNVIVRDSKELTDIFEAFHGDERVKRSYG
ncbi:unnamed protein product [Agarophyton chilense]